MKQICVYHAGCPDGFGAAWAIWSAWGGEGDFVPRGHNDRMRANQVTDSFVVFADIAPGNEELSELADSAQRVVVLDHHVSNYKRFLAAPKLSEELHACGHEIHFDMNHSGAVLAWQYFHRDEETPRLLRYVEDQDLWNWNLEHSEEINSAIASYPHDFETWNRLAKRPIKELIEEGASIVRINRVEVEKAVKHASPIAIENLKFEAVNSRTQRSAIGHVLAERKAYGQPCGCVYRVEGKKIHATLYSIGDYDVSKIAIKLGGGGHRNAAGFSVGLAAWSRDFVV